MSSTDPSPDTPQGIDASPGTEPAAKAAAEAQQNSDLNDLAKALVTVDEPCVQMMKGTVGLVDATAKPPTVAIFLGGDIKTPIYGVRHMDSYSPVVGDTVNILKQGADILILGQVNDSGTGSANGWQQPSLGSGFSHSGDPIMYRRVVDNGDLKIQLKGSCTMSGTPTFLFTLPAGFRPTTNRSMLVARSLNGGTGIQLLIGADGSMQVAGHNVGIGSVSAANNGRTGIEGGNAVTSDVFGSTNGFLQGRAATSGSTVSMDHNLTSNEQQNGHQHLFQHTHKGGNHQHDVDINSAGVASPTAMWLTGVEYFI